MEVGEQVSDLAQLRQGDVIELDWIPAVIEGRPGELPTPCGVAIVSQTCDIVQESASKANVTVAPIVCSPDPSHLSTARSGNAPLSIFLPELGERPAAIIDIQRAASVPKSVLMGRVLLERHTESDSGDSARKLAERIGRVFSRFAFPNEVVTVLEKLKKKARKAASGSGSFGRVLEYLDLRVRANHWDGPNRILSMFVIVESSLLIMEEDIDPGWNWQNAVVVGLKAHEQVDVANLTRLSELLADTCESYLSDPRSSDGTTLLRLWEIWVQLFKRELLDSQANEEVSEFRLELVGDEEFSVSKWRRTVSLDLEDLSEPTLALTMDDSGT